MDYIREELLRQQALLVILLTGQRLEPLEEERTESAGREAAWESAGAVPLRRKTSAESAQEIKAEDLWEFLAGGPLGGVQAADAAEERPAARRSAGADPAEPQRRRSGSGEERRPTAPAGTAPERAGEVRLVAELHPAQVQGGTDPAALSRAFQRDARRYDGGFRLY